jgi:hypothetical protein
MAFALLREAFRKTALQHGKRGRRRRSLASGAAQIVRSKLADRLRSIIRDDGMLQGGARSRDEMIYVLAYDS